MRDAGTSRARSDVGRCLGRLSGRSLILASRVRSDVAGLRSLIAAPDLSPIFFLSSNPRKSLAASRRLWSRAPYLSRLTLSRYGTGPRCLGSCRQLFDVIFVRLTLILLYLLTLILMLLRRQSQRPHPQIEPATATPAPQKKPETKAEPECTRRDDTLGGNARGRSRS